MSKAAELHEELVKKLKAAIPDGDFVTQCLFQPFPRLYGRHHAGSNNVLGIQDQPQDGFLWLAVAQVRTPEHETLAYSLVRDWVAEVKAFAGDEGTLPFTYLNSADKSQDPLGSYGAENVRLIREAAAKYDPRHVFQRLSRGGFKLSNVKI